MKYICNCFFILLINIGAYSQQSKLIAGPMQGHTTENSVKIWLMIKNTNSVSIILSDPNSAQNKKTIIVATDTLSSYKQQFPVVVEFSDLFPDTEYEINILLDETIINKKSKFKTLKNVPIADFSFLTGSCALQLSLVTRPFLRFGSDKIFRNMLGVPANFMIWLGDNTYYRKRNLIESDYASAAGMWKRQIKTRKINRMNDFLIRYPQYAIWDDHDYGSYDGDSNFPLKDTSLFIYKSFWANPSYGLPDAKGVFTTFRKYDAEFFLLDDRFYRTQPNMQEGGMLGKKQLNWLFEGLKKSDATFKFIILGSQMLNPHSQGECYDQFPAEKKDILDFIENNNINGIIFITGDMHYADLQKQERKNTYPIYDFTCSPLSSFLHTPSPEEIANVARVPNTLVYKHRNFGKVSVTGSIGNRVCSVELFDDNAKLLWKHEIPEKELR